MTEKRCGTCVHAIPSNRIHCSKCSCDVNANSDAYLCRGRHYEERTDSTEKLIRDMLEAIWCVGPYTGACDGITRECRYADDKGECRAAEEFTDRARALGIEVD